MPATQLQTSIIQVKPLLREFLVCKHVNVKRSRLTHSGKEKAVE
jgi:hypothetical protein